MLDFDAVGVKGSKKNLGLLLSAAALRTLDLFPLEACEAAIRRSSRSPIREENLEDRWAKRTYSRPVGRCPTLIAPSAPA